MANLNSFVETLAESQTTAFVEALDHAKDTSEDAPPEDLNVKADSSRCVQFGYSTDLHEAFRSELHKVKLLKTALTNKDKLINKRLTYIRELEYRLAREQHQTQVMRKRYEKERTLSHFLSQTLSKAHEVALSLQNRAARSEDLEVALREELHKRTAVISDLEEQNRQLVAALAKVMSRVREPAQESSHQISEKCMKDVRSQSLDSLAEPSDHVYQVNSTLHNTPSIMRPTTAKSVRSILKRPSTDDPALTTLITSATTWIRSRVQPTVTREVYFNRAECYPKPSSPEFRERVRRQLCLEQMALARNYLIYLPGPEAVERSKDDAQSSTFELKKREQMREEQHIFAQSSMQRLRMMRVEQQDQH